MNIYNPLISIIMPAYNMEAYIEDSIKSVISQDYQNWELLIMDDGSIDSTSSIIKKYADHDKRIRYFYHSNIGQGKTRNKALLMAGGNLVAFLDSDDLWLSNYLSVSIKEFFAGEQDVLFSSTYLFTDNSQLMNLSALKILSKDDFTYYGETGLAKLVYRYRITINTVLAKKDAILDVGGFGFSDITNIGEDACLWIKMVCKGYTLRGFSTPLSLYRQRSESTAHIQFNHDKEVMDMLMVVSKKYPILFNHRKQIRSHMRKYIKYSMRYTGNDIVKLDEYFSYFKFHTFITRLCLQFYKYIPFEIFKYIMITFFKQYKSKIKKIDYQ